MHNLRTHVIEILDYFGRCAACHYPAAAHLYTHHFADGSTEQEVIATCGLPCGWRGPVPPHRMTHPDPTASST